MNRYMNRYNTGTLHVDPEQSPYLGTGAFVTLPSCLAQPRKSPLDLQNLQKAKSSGLQCFDRTRFHKVHCQNKSCISSFLHKVPNRRHRRCWTLLYGFGRFVKRYIIVMSLQTQVLVAGGVKFQNTYKWPAHFRDDFWRYFVWKTKKKKMF